MRTNTLVWIVVAVLVVSAGIAYAVGPRGSGTQAGPGGQRGPGYGCCAALVDLGLTDSQKAQLAALRKEFADATAAAREQIQAKSKEMCRLWAAEQPDVAAIKALAAEIDVLRAEIRNLGIDYSAKSLALLNAEQRKKASSMCANCPGCPSCMGPLMGCGPMGPGAGRGMGPGAGCGMGPCGMGMGPGAGPRDGTGPRAQMGTCPYANK